MSRAAPSRVNADPVAAAAVGWSGPWIDWLPHSQADAAAVELLHARLLVQSVVKAFVDTFRYQAALGAAAFVLVLLFSSRPFTTMRRWILAMVR